MPKRGIALLTAVICLLLIGAHKPDSAEDYERRAEAAFAAGQYLEADFLYSRAEEISAEPGRTAYNHGVAFFQLGRYRDAERLFRCSLESTSDPDRKSRAWFNLGTSMLYASDGKDANRLAEAM